MKDFTDRIEWSLNEMQEAASDADEQIENRRRYAKHHKLKFDDDVTVKQTLTASIVSSWERETITVEWKGDKK
jgi:hypothetical protein